LLGLIKEYTQRIVSLFKESHSIVFKFQLLVEIDFDTGGNEIIPELNVYIYRLLPERI